MGNSIGSYVHVSASPTPSCSNIDRVAPRRRSGPSPSRCLPAAESSQSVSASIQSCIGQHVHKHIRPTVALSHAMSCRSIPFPFSIANPFDRKNDRIFNITILFYIERHHRSWCVRSCMPAEARREEKFNPLSTSNLMTANMGLICRPSACISLSALTA